MPEPQPGIDQYLEDLITDRFDRKGYNVEPEIRDELKKDAARQLDELFMARAIAALSDRDVNRLNKILTATQSTEAAQDFIAKHVPDFTKFTTNVLLEFQQIYLRG